MERGAVALHPSALAWPVRARRTLLSIQASVRCACKLTLLTPTHPPLKGVTQTKHALQKYFGRCDEMETRLEHRLYYTEHSPATHSDWQLKFRALNGWVRKGSTMHERGLSTGETYHRRHSRTCQIQVHSNASIKPPLPRP